MRWSGQHIYDLISRFRDDVYIEDNNLEISKVSGQPTLELSAWSATATSAHAGRIKFLKSGTAAVDTYTAGNHTTAGEILGRIEAYGIDDGDGETLSSYIEFANDAISDADSSPGKIIFATSDADDAGTPTVRLTIDDGGLATFTGGVTVGGAITGDVTGNASGTAAPVTGSTQAAITTCANLVSIGSINTGSWRGSVIASGFLDADTAHLSGTQTFTGAKTFTDTVALTGTGQITGVDTVSADTDAASKGYADRPAKQIVLMRAAFKDDIGTTKHYIPLQSELEQTTATHEMNSFVAPYTGKLLKLMYRGSGNFSGGTFTFTLEKITRNGAFATGGSLSTIETITATGPTNNATDPNMITVDFVGGSGTNAFVAGDNILVGIQSDTDVTSGTSKHFFTLVFEFDFSGLA